LYHFFLLC